MVRVSALCTLANQEAGNIPAFPEFGPGQLSLGPIKETLATLATGSKIINSYNITFS